MTNNDELAIKPVGNLFISDKCEVVFSPSKRPIAGFQFAGSVYSAEQVNALLAERDADKKRITELEQLRKNAFTSCKHWRDIFREAESRIAELEARTVSVPTFEEWCQMEDMKPLGWVREAMKEAYDGCRAAAGIKLEVGE